MLTQKDYQKIVDRLMSILGKNINIMNTEGIIIASGDASRIGSFHEGAKIAASEKADIIINEEDISHYKGVKKGINIPFFYNNQVVGVVGITGEPKEVIGFGKIIKELVELMIQEYENKKYEELQTRAMMSFIKELLKHPNVSLEEENVLKNRAKLIGFDLDLPRILVVTDIKGFGDFIFSKHLKELGVQELKDRIVEFIRNRLFLNEIVINLSEDRFVILLDFKRTSIDEFCMELQKGINEKFGLRCVTGIGPICKQIKDYYSSFTIANKLVDIGRKLNKEVLNFANYRLELLIYELNSIVDEDTRKLFLEKYQFILKNFSEDLIGTIKTYFESGMNIEVTSRKLFLHRNTILYRLNKIKEKFNIEITNPYICMEIYIAILLEQLSHKDEFGICAQKLGKKSHK